VATDKAPAYQWYPKDFDSDESVKFMTYEQEGVYRRLLDHQSLHGSIPSNPGEIAALVPKISRARFMKVCWPSMFHKFKPQEDGRLANTRMQRAREDFDTFVSGKQFAGRKSAEVRRAKFGTAQPRNVEQRSEPVRDVFRTPPEPASASASAFKEQEQRARVPPAAPSDPNRDPFTDREITERAGRFVERYLDLYAKHRHGARLPSNPNRDYTEAVTLCSTYPDARLDKLAVIFLTTDHEFAEKGSRTLAQFRSMAGWCDGKLAAHEAAKKSGAA